MEEWTDRLIAAVLTSFWLQAGSSREPVKGMALVFWNVSVGTRGAQHEGKRGGGQKFFVVPPTVYRALRDVEYKNDLKVEEVLNHQHSILVLHVPLQVDCTSLI